MTQAEREQEFIQLIRKLPPEELDEYTQRLRDIVAEKGGDNQK